MARSQKYLQWGKTVSEDRTFSEAKTGHFQGLVGFEAKDKDYKKCPLGRPRGLHLCAIMQ